MPRPEVLTSARNPFLKELRRAGSQGGLTREGYAVAEGLHLLEEALRSRAAVEAVVVSEAALGKVSGLLAETAGTRLLVTPEKVFQQISTTESPQGVIALFRPPGWTVKHVFSGETLVVILDGVQDPGNAGGVVRAAEAFGATGVLFLRGAASPWNPKSLRGAAGSLFRVPVVDRVTAEEAVEACASRGVALYAAVAHGGAPAHETDLRRPCALVIGSEGQGVGARLRAAARGVRIPTRGVESLNAAVAAGILLYEARRQRMSGGG
jgi:TrmH family RNA methyltransferase